MSNPNQSFNSFLIMIMKAAILVIIILCIFFIVYPHACDNMMTGNMADDPSITDINRHVSPAKLEPKPAPAPPAMTPAPKDGGEPQPQVDENGQYIYVHPEGEGKTVTIPQDTLSDQEELIKRQQAEQDAFDFDVIKRYVEVEKEYLASHPNDRNTANIVTAKVMQEKQLTAEDWQEIVLKANERGWFKELREAKE
ncbi:ADP-heptose:LPS heptosyltransferase [Elusimicrobium simillimum]|uniref:hypothetical protein n=1 Tax=Elusimicrobium simillimum TaxID=3143438 RepID=UPI003C6FC551